jgi:hypothetical protein
MEGRFFLFAQYYAYEIHYICAKIKVRSLNYIVLTGLVFILCWLGYILYEINAIENNLIVNIVPLISSLTSFITVLLFYIIFLEIKRINFTSLLLGAISLLFVLIMFFSPPTVLLVWNYAASVFVLFVVHGLHLLTGAGESGIIHRLTLVLTTLFLVTILLLKIELSIVHLLALALCLATTVTTLISVSPRRNQSR